jgi:pimeloyl-ACP methyl ester carboxylesterase
MPVFCREGQKIDYLDEGAGETVVLVHSSVSGNRQWLPFIETLKDRYRVIAPNLFGYGETTPWTGSAPQTLQAQAELILALCAEVEGPVHLVGHSFGGAVALRTAALLGARAGKLVLFEPMLPYLLQQDGRHDAYAESKELAEHVKHFGALGDWMTASGRFADYWLGDGSWAAMPEKRRAAFAGAITSCVHEFDAILGEPSTVDLCRSLTAKTMVMHDTTTRRPIREIVEILEEACSHWSFQRITGPGHMAPLTHPELINAIIGEFLG